MLPGGQRLLEHEQMFGPPIALQAAGDGIAAGFDAMVFEGGQLLRVALAGQDGFQDAKAGDTGEVGDDVVDLNVHLRQALCRWRI